MDGGYVMLNPGLLRSVGDRPLEKVEIPEWGAFCFVRSMSGTERDEYDAEVDRRCGPDGRMSDRKNFRAWVILRFCCDEHGNRIFGDEAGPSVQDRDWRVLDRLFDEILRVNQIGPKARSDGEYMQDTLKN